MDLDPALVTWLLDSDPALRWQVERDLLESPVEVWTETRTRVSTEGFGAQLLARQDPDGQWAGGAFFPREFAFSEMQNVGQPWTATTWSLSTLREWGLDPAVLSGTAERLAANCRWEYDDLPYWDGEVDCCINAYTLANGAWLGVDVTGIASWFVDHRLADGGWNCEWVEGSVRSSFHSTLNSLKGLLHFEEVTGGSDETRAARRAGEEYLLQRHLMRSLTTGAVLGPWVTEFGYPFRWRYSVLKAVDYFRSAARHDSTAADPRLIDAIEEIRSVRRPDGTWLQVRRLPGQVWFEVDAPVGEPSKWLTFFGSRALAWWDVERPGGA
jgi:hypothetical protein